MATSTFLCRGSGGEVHKGHLEGRKVAIKYLTKGGSFTRNELNAYKLGLDHKYVVPLLDLKETEEGYMLYMELADIDLLDYMDICPLDEDLCFHVARVALAIQYFHNRGIYHRDIKLENVLIRDTNTWLADFGSSTDREFSCEFVGSQQTACPEIHEGKKISSAMMDVWSLGILLYSVITGRYPWTKPVAADAYYNEYRKGLKRKPANMTEDAYELFKWATAKSKDKRCNLDQFIGHKFMKPYIDKC